MIPLLGALTVANAGEATAAGVHVTWTLDGEALSVTAEAQTTGWVLVGFHSQEQLSGSRLVMAAVTPAGPRLEEHVADPPRHAVRRTGATATALSVTEDDGRTTARFWIPLDPKDKSLPSLTPGSRTWLWLAWSHDDDFQHHSARREGIWVVL